MGFVAVLEIVAVADLMTLCLAMATVLIASLRINTYAPARINALTRILANRADRLEHIAMVR